MSTAERKLKQQQQQRQEQKRQQQHKRQQQQQQHVCSKLFAISAVVHWNAILAYVACGGVCGNAAATAMTSPPVYSLYTSAAL